MNVQTPPGARIAFVLVVCGLLVASPAAGAATASTGTQQSTATAGATTTIAQAATDTAPDCTAVPYEGGDGSAENPYQIGNVSQLQCISEDLDAHYVLVSDVDASGTAEWNGGAGFAPIGTNDTNSFVGSFDGANHTITDLTINRTEEETAGLFGALGPNGGTVERVALANVTVRALGRVGGLVGDMWGGTMISEVSVNGTVTGESSKVGGLVGRSYGTVTKSYSTATVSGYSSVGGLVGETIGEISESYAAGPATGDNNAGGLVGQNSFGTLTDAYWDVNSTGQGTSAGGTGLTTDEMTGVDATANMAGFDFEDTWKATGSYPRLSWQETEVPIPPLGISLSDPHLSTHGSGGAISQVPTIIPNRSIRLANGSNYRFVITDEDNGGTVTTTPPITRTTAESIILNNPDPDGTIDGEFGFWIPGVTDGLVDAPVTTSGDVATRGVVNLSVSVTDAESGATVAEAGPQPYVLGYVSEYTQSGTNGTFEIGVNRSVLPRNTSLTATVFNASASYEGATSDKVVVPLSYDASTDSFTGDVPGDELAGGNYSIAVEGTLPAPYETRFDRLSGNVFTVGTSSDGGGDGDSQTGTVSGNLTAASNASLTGDAVVAVNLTEDNSLRDRVRTNVSSSGEFELNASRDLTYHLAFGDDGENASSNGVPDLYAIERVTPPAELGNRTLPVAYNTTVRVVDESDDPIENASVIVQHTNGDAFVRAGSENATDGDGYLNRNGTTTFELAGEISATAVVESDSGAVYTASDSWTVDGDRDLVLAVDTSEPSTANVTGQVKLPDGSNATNDRIALDEVEGDRGNRTSTDQSGVFTQAVSVGTSYDVVYAQSGSASSERTFPIDDVPDVYPVTRTYVGGETDIGTRQLPAANRLNVTVTDRDGAPIPNATVHAEIRANDADAYAQGTTDSDGRLVVGGSIGLETYGAVEVDVIAPHDTSYTDEHVEVSLTDGDENVTVELAATVPVTGDVTDSTGTEVDSATVVYDGLEGTGSDAVTDPKGTYQVAVPNGTYDVRFAQSETRHDAATGFPLDGVPDIYSVEQTTVQGPTENDIELPEAHHLQVQVVDESDDPLANTSVFVGHVRDNEDVTGLETRTNESGYVMLGGTSGFEVNGSAFVDVQSDTHVGDEAQVDVTEDDTIVVDAREAVNFTSALEYFDGEAPTGHLINFEGEYGTGEEIGPNGNFTARLAANTTYDVTFKQTDYDDETGAYPKDGKPDLYALDRLAVGDEDFSLPGVTLPEAHRLNVTVRGSNDNPLSGVPVFVSHENNDARVTERATTNEDGELVLRGASTVGVEANGTVILNVDPSEAGLPYAPERVIANASDGHVNVTLQDAVDVTGNIGYTDDSVPEGYTVAAFGEGGTSRQVQADGSFTLPVLPNQEYDLGYKQTDWEGGQVDFPKDGRVDVYAFQPFSVGTEPKSLGPVTLPEAHTLNVTVVNGSGVPVPGAEVDVLPINGEATAHHPGYTNENGEVVLDGAAAPGIEANGTVRIHVPSTEQYGENATTVTVHSDMDATVTVREPHRVAGTWTYPNGSAVSDTRWVLLNWDNVNTGGTTDESGSFETYVPPRGNENYTASIYPLDTGDGVVDVWNVRLNVTGDTTFEEQLPRGYNVTLSATTETGETADTQINVVNGADGWIYEYGTGQNLDSAWATGSTPGERPWLHVQTRELSNGTHNVTVLDSWTHDVLNESVITVNGSDRRVNYTVDRYPSVDQSTVEAGTVARDVEDPGLRSDTTESLLRDGFNVRLTVFGASESTNLSIAETLPDGYALNESYGLGESPPGLTYDGTGSVSMTYDQENGVLHLDVEGNVSDIRYRVVPTGEPRNVARFGGSVENRTATDPTPTPVVGESGLDTGEYVITGQVDLPDGEPAVDSTVAVFDLESDEGVDAAITNDSGAFSLTAPTNAPVSLAVYQPNLSESPVVVPNRDGVADVYAVERLNRTEDYETAITLPVGHVLNVTVVNETSPVPNTNVTITQHGPDGSAAGIQNATIASDGVFTPAGSEAPGLEVNGSVTVELHPPENYTVTDPVRERKVNSSTDVEYVLNATTDDGSTGDGGDDGSDDGGSDDGGDDGTGDGNETDGGDGAENVTVLSANLSATTITAGENVTVNATIENPTDSTVTLTVELRNGTNIINQDSNVTVQPGTHEVTVFERPFNEPGTYDLSVNDVSAGTLEVQADDTEETETTDTGTPGFGIGAAIAGLLAAALVAVRVRD